MLETLLQPGDVEERCGLILKDGTIIQLPNRADNKQTSFEMAAEDLLPYLEDAAATWHTHPDGDPNLSGEDYSCFLAWPDLMHVIIGVRNGATTVMRFCVQQGLVLVCD